MEAPPNYTSQENQNDSSTSLPESPVITEIKHSTDESEYEMSNRDKVSHQPHTPNIYTHHTPGIIINTNIFIIQ